MAKSSFNLNVSPSVILFALFIGVVVMKGLHCNKDSDDESTESKPNVTVKTGPSDDDVTITKRMMSGSENDTLVVRTRDQQYVRIGELIFCWRSNALVGVFNKDGLVSGWQTMTNQPPPK